MASKPVADNDLGAIESFLRFMVEDIVNDPEVNWMLAKTDPASFFHSYVTKYLARR